MSVRAMVFLSLAPALFIAAPAVQAQSPVTVGTDIETIRTTTDAAGKTSEQYAKPEVVTPGDRLRFTVHYRNTGVVPANKFVITNPVPEQVVIDRIIDSADAQVSVDGGGTYGVLSTLSVAAADGTRRPAVLADVTHIRWTLATVAPATAGTRRFVAHVK